MICCMTCMTFIDIIFLHHALQSRGEKNMIGMQYEDGDITSSSQLVGPYTVYGSIVSADIRAN